MGTEFYGTGVALITPFDERLELDINSLGRLLEHTRELDYWVINGTTGESPALTESELYTITRFVHENNPRKLPIMYGIGGNNTSKVLQQIKNTDFKKISGILSVCPYYNKPTQEGLFRHYSLIADQAPVPVYVYNVPGRTACNIEAATILRLAEHENIKGVKEASANMEQCNIIARNKPDDFLLISGDDVSTVPIIKMGGAGVISVMANAFPDLMSKMVSSALDQQWEAAQNILEVLLPVNPLMYQESNPVGVKKMLHLLEVCLPYVRLPLLPASPELSNKLASILQEMSVTKKSG